MVVILSQGCSSIPVNSQWTDVSVVVDGQNTDWEEMSKTYFKDAGISLGMCNDIDNLYVLIQFRDSKLLRTASSRGFTIWLDESASKKKDLGLRYICNPPIDLRQLRDDKMDSGRHNLRRRRTPDVHKKVYEQIVVLNGPEDRGRSTNPDGSQGPAACLGSANGVFVYEFAIPLKSSATIQHAINTEMGSDISIGFELSSMDTEKSSQTRQQMGGKGGGGMKGGRGGGGMSGGQDGGNGQSRGMMQFEDIWIKCSLASPPIKKHQE